MEAGEDQHGTLNRVHNNVWGIFFCEIILINRFRRLCLLYFRVGAFQKVSKCPLITSRPVIVAENMIGCAMYELVSVVAGLNDTLWS